MLTQPSSLGLSQDQENLVSRNHCEIYAVKYDSGVHHIYARDRGSCNGTFVNGMKIGNGPGNPSGYLLQHGDEVQILPHWRFTLSQPDSPPPHELTKLQKEECKVKAFSRILDTRWLTYLQLFEDKYSLTNRCLGQGAEATVHLATEMATKKQLVCKVVNLDKIKGKNSAEELRRRRQEVDILRQLRHVSGVTSTFTKITTNILTAQHPCIRGCNHFAPYAV